MIAIFQIYVMKLGGFAAAHMALRFVLVKHRAHTLPKHRVFVLQLFGNVFVHRGF